MIRMSIEYVLAAIFAVLAVVTVLIPQWIEAVFNVDPDRGTGTLEWAIVAAFGLLALIAAVLGTRDAVAVHRKSAGGTT